MSDYLGYNRQYWINVMPVEPIVFLLENWSFKEEDNNKSQPLSIRSNLKVAIDIINEIRDYKQTAAEIFESTDSLLIFRAFSM